MLLRSLVLTALALTLSACNLSGTGEKGPFKTSSNVSLSKINTQANPIVSQTLNTTVYSNNGAYSFSNIQWNDWAQLQVSGQYFNEFTASTSTDVITLDAITKKDRTFDTANVHLFSHLAAARIRQRVADGQNRLNAWKDTQTEMKQIFGLKKVSRNIHRGVEQLRLQRGSGRYRKDNANLLLFTGSFLAAGGDAASLAQLTTDFADDGQFNGVGSTFFNVIASTGATDGLLGDLSSNLHNYGIGNPPNDGDMSQLPIWVNQDTADNEAPVVTVDGTNPITIVVGTPYVDEGASATDNVDGTVDAIAIDSSDVIDTAVIGTHTVTYNATDVAGNVGSATRIVNVVQAPDTEAPVIVLLGDNPETLEVDTGEVIPDYQDPGYTVTDNRDDNLTLDVIGTVQTDVLGTYVLTYATSDVAGNDAIAERTVEVVDTTDPVISLNGANAVSVVAGTTYEDQGATATDNYYGAIDVGVSGAVDTEIVDTYTITYTAEDGSNNVATKTRTVTVTEAPDTTAPVITLKGDTSVIVEAGTGYTDAGATALDNKDGDLTTAIVVGGSVNVNVPATYILTYNVQDAVPNSAVEVTRTVIVRDTISPEITLIGDSAISLVEGTSYTDTGATASDSLDGDITTDITIGGDTVDTTTPGVYTITYNVMDNAQNSAVQVTRTVTITEAPDTTAPVITLLGDASVIVEAGTNYSDAGATALDDKDGDLTGAIVVGGSVNVNVPATYTLTYNVQDAVPNTAIQVTRTVIVKDTIVPTITLVGDAALVIQKDASYSDAGAAAPDSLDGGITANIVVNNPVNSGTPATYTVTYAVSDAAGNPAPAVTRSVRVNAPPTANAGPDVSVETGNSVNLVGSGSDTDGAGTVTYQWKRGGWIISTSASYSYTPENSETLTFEVRDSDGAISTDTVDITVNLPAPYQIVFINDTTEVPRNLDSALFTQGLTAITSVIDSNGDVVTDAVPTFDVSVVDLSTPATYPLVFSYTDSYNRTITSTLTVIVVNHSPIATSDNITVDEDSANNVITLIATDTDQGDRDTLTYAYTQATNGTVTGTGKNVAYTPNANYAGADSFTFTVSDGFAESTGTINITVTDIPEPNTAPVASSQSVSVDEDSNIAITLVGTDADAGDTLTYSITEPSNGVLSGSGANVTYTPNPNYAGTDSFDFTVSDGTDSDTATVSITVNPLGDAPVATPQPTIVVDEDSSNTPITLSGTDADGDTLIFEDISGSTPNGTLDLVADGTNQNYRYTPDEDYSGSDSFTFTVSDGTLTSVPVTINISVTSDNNHAPVGDTQATITVAEGSSSNVIPTLTATDADAGDTLTFEDISGSTTNGTLELVADGTNQNYRYTPDEDYSGSDSFTFTVTDGDDESVPVTINISVTSDNNHAPVGDTQATITVAENSSSNVIPTLTATDADAGDTLTFEDISGSTLHGYLDLVDDGTNQNYRYTPDEDYSGSDSFTFTVSDGDDVSAEVTINIEITPIIAPTANAGGNQSVEVNQSITLSGSASTDSDGNIVQYEWSENGTVLHTTDHYEFNYTPSTEGDHSITLTVKDDDDATATDTIVVTAIPLQVVTATCRATPATDVAFIDMFVNFGTLDTPWPDSLNNGALSVDQIASAFNTARATTDPFELQGKALVMPLQAVWDGYSDSQKALYLINSERCARGILPYEGISLGVEEDVAQYYADYLADNNVFGHNEDGRDPFERLSQLAGVVTPGGGPNNADSFSYAENLASNSLGSTGSPPTIHEPVAKAIYAWMYDDKESTRANIAEPPAENFIYTYGHRKFILATGLVENSGEANKEGLIGIGVSTVQESIDGLNWTKTYTVMNAFDPNENGFMGGIETVDFLGSNQCLDGYIGETVTNNDGSTALVCSYGLDQIGDFNNHSTVDGVLNIDISQYYLGDDTGLTWTLVSYEHVQGDGPGSDHHAVDRNEFGKPTSEIDNPNWILIDSDGVVNVTNDSQFLAYWSGVIQVEDASGHIYTSNEFSIDMQPE